MTAYSAPIRDMLFTLRSVGDFDRIAALPGNEEVSEDLVQAIFEEAGKFAGDVLAAITGRAEPDEFKAIDELGRLAGEPPHRAVRGLQERPVLHDRVLTISQMREAVIGFADGLVGRA